MAGHMGADRVTDAEPEGACRSTPRTTCCSCEGAVPGGPSGYVVIRKAVAAKPEPKPQVEKPTKGRRRAKK